VAKFLDKVQKTPAVAEKKPKGRLIFAMDATASREPLWDTASHYHADMFIQAESLGSLAIQLCYYRGYGDFKASGWHADPAPLGREITAVRCLAGRTQIARILKHAIKESRAHKVNAVVFVGDCMEESIDKLGDLAGRLGILGVPVFIFQEGRDPVAGRGFSHIARLTHGAHCQFNAESASQLGKLLGAVAVFASGGKSALTQYSLESGSQVKALLEQLK